MKRGRKRIVCDYGNKHPYSFWCYPNEIVQLRIEYKKIISQRHKYTRKENNNETSE